jgi:DNA-binding CsgD family transcriptional regulator
MDAVLDSLPVGHPARVNAVTYTALLLRMLGAPEDARALLSIELDRLPDPAAADSLHLRLQLATYCVLRGQLRDADEWLCRVIELGRDTAAALIARAMRPVTGYPAGPAPAGPAPTATILLDTLDDADIARNIDVFIVLCWTGLYADGPPESLRRLRRCHRIAVAAGHSFALPYLLSAQAHVQALMARITEARQAADEATEIARLLGAAEPLALGLLTQCWVQGCAGAHAEAVTTGEQAVAAAQASRGWLPMAGAMLAFARIGAGDVERGRTDLVAAGGGPELATMFPHNRLTACTVLSETAAARGDVAEAARWADLAERVVQLGRGAGHGLATLARAYANGPTDRAEAARLAEQAATILTDADLLMAAGRGWLLAASCHARRGDPEAANRAMTHAARAYDGSGADALQGEVHRLRRELSVRPSTDGTAELTRREAEIAALIAAGCSNPDIANQLFLSVRTVETHVSRIYAKLGVTTRAAAVSRLARMPSHR